MFKIVFYGVNVLMVKLGVLGFGFIFVSVHIFSQFGLKPSLSQTSLQN